jgi:hypothetical protein
MITRDKLTEIFCEVDDFCKEFEIELNKLLLSDAKVHRRRKSKLSYSEVITIMITFHIGGFRCLKHFYLECISRYYQDEFPDLVSYNRFIELSQKIILPMTLFLKMRGLGQCTGISFIDSTSINVCKNKRIQRNRVFKGIAERGKSTMGWFFGFKLHLIVNEKGEIINFALSKGNTDDRDVSTIKRMIKNVFGKLYGDKGYISNKLFHYLFNDGIELITKIKSNMKNQVMSLRDKLLLRKRFIIETINDQLKNISQIEHTRHRSVLGFLSNLISGLIAYCFQEKKPSLNLEFCKTKQMALFC